MTTSLTPRRYTPADAEAWDAFVERSINGTLMHTRRFLAYHAPEKFQDCSWLFSDDTGQLRGVFPAAESTIDGERTWRSHPGASYGGLVVGDECSHALATELVAALVTKARQSGVRQIWMRHAEKVFHRRWCEELDAALFQAGFLLDSRELSCAVPLAGDFDEVPACFLPAAQRAVRKALKSGVTARISDDWPAFWRILEANLLAQHQVSPTHRLDEIERLGASFPDRVVLVAAYHADEMLAGAVLFFMNGMAAHTMYMAQDYRFQSLRPLNLVLAVALREAARRGVAWLNYGISSIPGTRGQEVNAGLHAFKRNCGGQGVVRDGFLLRVPE